MKDNGGTARRTPTAGWSPRSRRPSAVRSATCGSPTCLGDPGKVSDAEYFCDTGDAGGVHSNSGVPNHAYALLVDGGTSNGVNVVGHRPRQGGQPAGSYNQTHFLTPTSGFPEFADGLTASCAALIEPADQQGPARRQRHPAARPRRSRPPTASRWPTSSPRPSCAGSPPSATSSPCSARTTRRTCGPGTKRNVVWSEGFEVGSGWHGPRARRSSSRVASASLGARSPTLPTTTGAVAYGQATRAGVCSNGAGDASSKRLDHQPGDRPAGGGSKGAAADVRPLHRLASSTSTVATFHLSVNGGAFTLDPDGGVHLQRSELDAAHGRGRQHQPDGG